MALFTGYIGRVSKMSSVFDKLSFDNTTSLFKKHSASKECLVHAA